MNDSLYKSTFSRSFDWSLIRSFIVVMELGSLTAAAKAAGMAQPTLGRHIDELERQLGLVLFERTRSGLLPTPQAFALREAANQMANGADTLHRIATGLDSDIRGNVRVTASQTLAISVLPALFAELHIRHPQIYVTLVASNEIADLGKREADIALRMVEPTEVALITRKLGYIKVVACAHKAYLGRAGIPKSASDLLKHTLITGDRRNEVAEGMAKFGFPIEKLRFGLRSDDLIVQWAAIRAGLGIGFLADCLVNTDPDIVPVLHNFPMPSFPLWLTVHREVRTSARLRATFDFLLETLPKQLSRTV